MARGSHYHLDKLSTDEDAAEGIIRFRNVDVNDTVSRRDYMRWFFGKTRGLSADGFETKMAAAQVEIFNQLMMTRVVSISTRTNATRLEYVVWRLLG